MERKRHLRSRSDIETDSPAKEMCASPTSTSSGSSSHGNANGRHSNHPHSNRSRRAAGIQHRDSCYIRRLRLVPVIRKWGVGRE